MSDIEKKGDTIMDANFDEDELQLAALGKKQVMKRNFNVWSLIFMCFCTSVTWEALTSTMFQALNSGGSSSMVFGFLVTAFGTLLIALSISEFASIIPTSGGQYHYVAALGPPKYQRVLSFYAAWITMYGWVISCTSGIFAGTLQIQAYMILFAPDYIYERWHTSLILMAFITFFTAVNVFGIKILSRIQTLGIVLHVAGFIVTIIYLLVKVYPKNTAEFVFTDTTNYTGWESGGIAWSIGLLSSAIGLVGWDSASHMAEEMKHAARDLPRAMVGSVALTGILTFPWIIALMFCITDLETLLTGPVASLNPLVQLIYNVSGGDQATTIGITCFFMLLSFFVAGPSVVAATSRVVWSFSREGGLHRAFGIVNERQEVPVNALLLVWLLNCLLSLIYIGNSTAFYGIASGASVVMIFSYAMPIFLNVFWGIKHNNLTPGPFTLGRYSLAINIAALMWSTYLMIFLCFPSIMPVTEVNMNYSSLVFGFSLFLPTVAWFWYGKKGYLGIAEELDSAMLAQAAEMIQARHKIATD